MIKIYLTLIFLIVSTYCFGQSRSVRDNKLSDKNELAVKSPFTYFVKATSYGCIDSLFSVVEMGQISHYRKRVDTVYNRIETNIDTINFEVVIMNYLDGKSIVKSIKNNKTNIAFWNQYQKSGELAEQGYTLDYLTRIGQWEFYSSTGDLDSIKDYDAERTLSFCKVWEILKNKPEFNSDIEYTYDYKEGLWRLKNWTTNVKYTVGQNGALIESKDR